MKKVLAIALIISIGLVGCYSAKKTTVPVGECPPPPAAIVVPAKPAVVTPPVVVPPVVVAPAPKPEIIPFYFGFDKYNVVDQKKAIERATTILNADKTKKAEIQGNCDRKGSEKYNMKLGQKRADTIKNILVKNGVDSKRLTTKSFGESKATGNDAKDRRVDIVISK